jgi:hypothetical protein
VPGPFASSSYMRMLLTAGLALAFAFNAGLTLAQGTPPGIVGRWQSPDSEVVIKADGTLTIDGTPYRYTVAGKIVMLIGADGMVPIPFELNGDRLTVQVDGEIVVLQRLAPGAPSRPRAAEPTSPAGSSNGSELAGKWCYLSNVTASNGGRMSDECFTIYPNGTYQYYAETSSSGPNGGTASQQSDSGTWSLNGSSLTVNSRSQGRSVYPLTKRNHPKNNDPMLCLDGRCFVTYGPKPPWR